MYVFFENRFLEKKQRRDIYSRTSFIDFMSFNQSNFT